MELSRICLSLKIFSKSTIIKLFTALSELGVLPTGCGGIVNSKIV